jgi:hypothetical protein
MNEELQNEVEQNANLVYDETRKFVAGMEPSLTAATIAFDMLSRESIGELVMSDWSEKERSILEPYVWVIVNKKFAEAFESAVTDCEELRCPKLSDSNVRIVLEPQPKAH